MISPVVIVALLGLTMAPAVYASPVNLASAVDHVVLPTPRPQCVPATCGFPACAAVEEICSEVLANCAEGFYCPFNYTESIAARTVLPKPRPQCAPATCGLPACAANTEVCSEVLANCAEGFYCPFNYTESISARTVLPEPRPQCVPATCGLEGCATASVCSEGLANCAEGFDCPFNVTCTPDRCNWPICYEKGACQTVKPEPECVPASCGLEACADAEVCGEALANCAEGFDCPLNVTCTPNRCNWPVCYQKGACQEAPVISERQLGCPPGKLCGHGPACTESTCHIPACAESAVCLQKQPIPCPPGKFCGHGPAICTGMDCADPHCADAPSCKKNSLEKKDDLPLSDKFTWWLPTRVPGDTLYNPPQECFCPNLEICAVSGYCVCQSDGLPAAEVPHIPQPPLNDTADSDIPTLHGSGKPRCQRQCNDYPFCICLSGTDCQCDANPSTPTGYDLEGKEYHGYAGPKNFSICGQVCTADDFCICKENSLPGCQCPINTSKWSPFDLTDAPQGDAVLGGLFKNCTEPGEAPPSLNGTHPCPDACDQFGRCGCDFEGTHGAIKRVPQGKIHHPCPLICDGKGHCGCKTEERSTTFIDACSYVCDEEGKCGCDAVHADGEKA